MNEARKKGDILGRFEEVGWAGSRPTWWKVRAVADRTEFELWRAQSGSSATYKHLALLYQLPHSPRLPSPFSLPTLNVVCRRKHTFAILCLVVFPPLSPSTPNHHVSRLLRTAARTVAASASPCPATCLDCPNDALTTSSLLSTNTTYRVWWEPIPTHSCTRRKWRQLCPRIWRVHQRSCGTDGLPSRTACDEGWSGIHGAERVY